MRRDHYNEMKTLVAEIKKLVVTVDPPLKKQPDVPKTEFEIKMEPITQLKALQRKHHATTDPETAHQLQLKIQQTKQKLSDLVQQHAKTELVLLTTSWLFFLFTQPFS
jgi:glycerol dehydrogenase-like iron-containing ADH family enzyme